MDQDNNLDLLIQQLFAYIIEGNKYPQAGYIPFLVPQLVHKATALIIATFKYCKVFKECRYPLKTIKKWKILQALSTQ